jgi:hypothetical protein
MRAAGIAGLFSYIFSSIIQALAEGPFTGWALEVNKACFRSLYLAEQGFGCDTWRGLSLVSTQGPRQMLHS